jgi:hypothetical protein
MTVVSNSAFHSDIQDRLNPKDDIQVDIFRDFASPSPVKN